MNSGNRGARGHKGSVWNLLSCKRGKGFKMSSINTKIAAQSRKRQAAKRHRPNLNREPTSQSAVVAKIAALQLAGTLAKIRFKKILIIIGIGAYLEDKFSQFILTLIPRGFQFFRGGGTIMRHHNIFASRDSHAKLICSVSRLGVNVQTWPQVYEISLSKKKRNKMIP